MSWGSLSTIVVRVLTLRMWKAAASALALLRQARITLAPLFARSRAVALPMPVLLPVQEKHQAEHHPEHKQLG